MVLRGVILNVFTWTWWLAWVWHLKPLSPAPSSKVSVPSNSRLTAPPQPRRRRCPFWHVSLRTAKHTFPTTGLMATWGGGGSAVQNNQKFMMKYISISIYLYRMMSAALQGEDILKAQIYKHFTWSWRRSEGASPSRNFIRQAPLKHTNTTVLVVEQKSVFTKTLWRHFQINHFWLQKRTKHVRTLTD